MFLAYKERIVAIIEDLKKVESYWTQRMELITIIIEGSNILELMIEIASKPRKNMLRTNLYHRELLL